MCLGKWWSIISGERLENFVWGNADDLRAGEYWGIMSRAILGKYVWENADELCLERNHVWGNAVKKNVSHLVNYKDLKEIIEKMSRKMLERHIVENAKKKKKKKKNRFRKLLEKHIIQRC